MVKMIFSFAAAMVLAVCSLALPALALDEVAIDGVEQAERVDCEATEPVLGTAVTTAQAETAGTAIASDEGVEPALRIVTVDAWQVPHKPSLNEPIASDHATAHLQPCLTSRTGFMLPSPVEHRIRQRHDERVGESANGRRHRSNHRLS